MELSGAKQGPNLSRQIVLKCDLQSGRKLLPGGMRLRVLISNSYGVRAADEERTIHVIRRGDFEWA